MWSFGCDNDDPLTDGCSRVALCRSVSRRSAGGRKSAVTLRDNSLLSQNNFGHCLRFGQGSLIFVETDGGLLELFKIYHDA